jgi:glycerol-3-phosphate acyltransferase PlsY
MTTLLRTSALFFLPGLSVVLGHNYSIFLRFRGGKGVSTSLGLLMIIHPLLMISAVCTAVSLAFLTKYVFIGTVGSFIILSLFGIMWVPPRILYLLWGLTAIIVLAHTDNYARFISGNEFRITDRLKKK